MMDLWNDKDGGGFFNGNDTPTQSNKSASRQPFLCPVTAKQILEASEEGVKIGPRTATMVSMVGITSNVEKTSSNIKFGLSDDTGMVDCVEWIESDDEGKQRDILNLKENTYYHVFGCMKNTQGRNRIMVFKRIPVKEFNEVTAFMLEVLHANNYTEKETKVSEQIPKTKADFYNYENSLGMPAQSKKSAFTPVQKRVFDAVKAAKTPIGWSKYDPEIRKLYTAKQIQDAVDFLVGEGHMYTTVDDDHFYPTAS